MGNLQQADREIYGLIKEQQDGIPQHELAAQYPARAATVPSVE